MKKNSSRKKVLNLKSELNGIKYFKFFKIFLKKRRTIGINVVVVYNNIKQLFYILNKGKLK